uniref:Nodule inception protein n=1 Tax=Meloidogyne hapla TaxID=6305 RepID=A0A1I8BKS0_MELHA
MEIYNPIKNQWDFGAPMVTHEGGVAAVVVPTMPRMHTSRTNNNNNSSGTKRPYNFDDCGEDGGGGPSTSRRMSEQIE